MLPSFLLPHNVLRSHAAPAHQHNLQTHPALLTTIRQRQPNHIKPPLLCLLCRCLTNREPWTLTRNCYHIHIHTQCLFVWPPCADSPSSHCTDRRPCWITATTSGRGSKASHWSIHPPKSPPNESQDKPRSQGYMLLQHNNNTLPSQPIKCCMI